MSLPLQDSAELDGAMAQLALIHALANDITADNFADKRLYLLQTCVRLADVLAASPAVPSSVEDDEMIRRQRADQVLAGVDAANKRIASMSPTPAQAEAVAVTDEMVIQAGDVLMRHGLNAPEQVIYQAARAALEAALSRPVAQAGAVAVKALEWKVTTEISQKATAIGLRYYVYLNGDDGLWHSYTEGYQPARLGQYGDQSEAKAAAQADYESRIRSALVTHPLQAGAVAETIDEILSQTATAIACDEWFRKGKDDRSAYEVEEFSRRIKTRLLEAAVKLAEPYRDRAARAEAALVSQPLQAGAESENATEIAWQIANECWLDTFDKRKLANRIAATIAQIQQRLAEQRDHIRKQVEDIMTLGALVYAPGNPPVEWKARAEAAEAKLAEAAEVLEPFAKLADNGQGKQRYFMQLLMCPEGSPDPDDWGAKFRRARSFRASMEKTDG